MKRFFVSLLVIIIIIAGGGISFVVVRQNLRPTISQGTITLLPLNEGTLDLSNRGITTFGPEVYDNVQTTKLVLSENQLRSLPAEIGQMKGLVSLKLDNNQLGGSLPKEIANLSLISLDASHNNMTAMPANIGSISTLKILDYSYNNLTELPTEITMLKQLNLLDLTGNPIRPDTIALLKSQLPNTTIIF